MEKFIFCAVSFFKITGISYREGSRKVEDFTV